MRVPSLGQDTPLEEGVATHCRDSYGQRSLAGCSLKQLKQLSMHIAETMSRRGHVLRSQAVMSLRETVFN